MRCCASGVQLHMCRCGSAAVRRVARVLHLLLRACCSKGCQNEQRLLWGAAWRACHLIWHLHDHIRLLTVVCLPLHRRIRHVARPQKMHSSIIPGQLSPLGRMLHTKQQLTRSQACVC